jgi:hypothetical protein
MSRTSVKHVDTEDIDRVEDSKELGAHSPSLGDDDDAVVLVKPLDSRPPPRAGIKALANFGLDTS